MPVNDRYPLDDVLAECRRYVELRRRKVFVEYVMLAGVNDSPADASALAGVLDGRSFKVNLIPYNPTGLDYKGDTRFEGSGREVIERFKNILGRAGIPATVRLTRAETSRRRVGSWQSHKGPGSEPPRPRLRVVRGGVQGPPPDGASSSHSPRVSARFGCEAGRCACRWEVSKQSAAVSKALE